MLIERYALQSAKVMVPMGRLASAERYKGFDQLPNCSIAFRHSGTSSRSLGSNHNAAGCERNVTAMDPTWRWL
jgi:hypothetical protein